MEHDFIHHHDHIVSDADEHWLRPGPAFQARYHHDGNFDFPETKARSFNALNAYIGERYYEFMEVARKIVNPGYDWKFLEAVVDHKSRQDTLMNMMEKMPLGLNLIYHIVLNALKFRILSWSRFSQTGIS